MDTAFRPDGLQLAWDSTSLGKLMECPRKYYLGIKLGYAPKGDQPNLTFGLLYHGICEAYDHEIVKGASHDDAVDAALNWGLVNSYGWNSDHETKTRWTLLRTAIWYLDQFGANDPCKTITLFNGKPAVELSFRFDLDIQTKQGENFMLCGHIDRLAEFQDRPWVMDRKTTKGALAAMYFAQYNPHHQLPLYNLAGKIVYQQPVAGVMVDAAQVLVGGSRFQRNPIPYTPAQLDEFLETAKWNIKMAEVYFDLDFYPMNPTACHHYGGCPFRGICSKDPSVRESFLQGDFIRRVWDPLQVRGDI